MGNDGERSHAPKMSRAIQDHIGRELREMYAELLRQQLPENLVAPLRAEGELNQEDHAGHEARRNPLLSQAKVA
jgi:hypothetical protein